MRYLKNKILKAKEAYERSLNTNSNVKIDSPTPSDDLGRFNPLLESQFSTIFRQDLCNDNSQQKPKSTRHKSKLDAERVISSTKNISINYGKAISSFAISALALPYLQPTFDQGEVSLNDFILFMNHAKTKIGGISSLRSLLMINDKVDGVKTMMLKKTFKMIGEVFIKYFSVNWIIHGKVTHKLVYLKFRSKMLRRFENPELFTYVRKRESKNN